MNERNISPEHHEEIDPDDLTAKQREMAEASLPAYEDTPIEKEQLRDCEKEVAILEEGLELFETSFPLGELLKITDLTPADAPNHSVREPARKALIPIVALLNTLKEETNISKDRHDALKERYGTLSKAVGFINNNKVKH